MENTILPDYRQKPVFTGRQLKPPVPQPAEEPTPALPGFSDMPADVPETPDAVQEPPRAAQRVRYRKSSRIPLFLLTAAAVASGVYFAASAPAGTDFSGSIFCTSGDFGGILAGRLLWGCAFLAAEYVCGYFALGWLFIWAAPVLCGLGTGAALTGAFAAGKNAAPLIIPAAGAVLSVILAAGSSREMSSQLLRLVSAGRSTVISPEPAAGEYTLRFLGHFALLAACAIAEAALRAFVLG